MEMSLSLDIHEQLVLEHWLTFPLMRQAYELKESSTISLIAASTGKWQSLSMIAG